MIRNTVRSPWSWVHFWSIKTKLILQSKKRQWNVLCAGFGFFFKFCAKLHRFYHSETRKIAILHGSGIKIKEIPKLCAELPREQLWEPFGSTFGSTLAPFGRPWAKKWAPHACSKKEVEKGDATLSKPRRVNLGKLVGGP